MKFFHLASLNHNKKIVAETKYAVLGLTGLYFVWFVFLVSSRLQTKRYYISQAALQQTIEERDTEVAEVVRTENPLEQYEEPIQLLYKEILGERASMQSKIDQILRLAETLGSIEEKSVSAQGILLTSTDDKEFPEKSSSEQQTDSILHHWKGLISVSSLREIPDDQLEASFSNAAKEIRAIENSMDENLMKQFMFDTSLGTSVVKKPSEFKCPSEIGRAHV